MTRLILPGKRRGRLRVPASKSLTHRLLICAALSREESSLLCEGLSQDILATIACLRAFGAEIREAEPGMLQICPIREQTEGELLLPCGESGTTLRLLLPLAGALGVRARFLREGRLPRRPLAPLDRELSAHGMVLREEGELLCAEGKLLPGDFSLPGNVSSQFISGLLLALPLLNGSSRLTVTGPVESAAYIRMTEDVLEQAGIRFRKEGASYAVPGAQSYRMTGCRAVEGDWSNAAFFLCMGALSRRGILVEGLSPDSVQGDRAVLELLRRFGAELGYTESGVFVSRRELLPITVDAAPIPDLVPVLSVLAAGAVGESRILNAGRLRLKESDRLQTTAALLRALGGEAEEGEDCLLIRGKGFLRGGRADSAGDHRIAMSAAAAACLCAGPVELEGAEAVSKSYPRFWEDFESLEAEAP